MLAMGIFFKQVYLWSCRVRTFFGMLYARNVLPPKRIVITGSSCRKQKVPNLIIELVGMLLFYLVAVRTGYTRR